MQAKVIYEDKVLGIGEYPITLKKYSENIYTCEPKLTNEPYKNYIGVVIKHKGLYIYTNDMTFSRLKELESKANRFADNFEAESNKLENPTEVNYYVFEKLGYDVSTLMENGKAYLRNLLTKKENQNTLLAHFPLKSKVRIKGIDEIYFVVGVFKVENDVWSSIHDSPPYAYILADNKDVKITAEQVKESSNKFPHYQLQKA